LRRPLRRLVRWSASVLKLLKSVENPLPNHARFLDALGPGDSLEMLGLRGLQVDAQGCALGTHKDRLPNLLEILFKVRQIMSVPE